MSPPASSPPRLALALLARHLPAGEQDMIVGDLTELYLDRLDNGRRFNRLWFWMQTAGFLLGFAAGPARMTASRRPRRSNMSRIIATVRHACRRLVYEWRYSGAVVLVLAIGIGPAAAMLSVVDTIVLRPLDYAEPDRLAIVRLHLGQIQNHAGLSLAEISDFRGTAGLFAGVEAASRRSEVSLGPVGDLEPLTALDVTPGLLPMLGVTPVIGRSFTADDVESDTPRVLLDHGAWLQHFGGDEAIVGRTIRINGATADVLGILPRGFRLATGRGVPEPIDVYRPLDVGDSRNFWAFPTLVRLADETTLDQANAALEALAASLVRTYPEAYADADLRFRLHPLKDDMTRDVRPAMRAGLAGVLLLLLVALANATALVLARLSTRAHDLAVRSAIGASRGALVSDVFAESAVLGGAGALAGAGIAIGAVAAARQLMPRTVPRWDTIGADWDLVFYSAGFALVGLVASGLIPVWKVSRRAPWLSMRGGPAGSGRADGVPRLVLVGAQIALTVVLAFGAIQLLRSASRLGTVDVGYEANVLAFRVPLDNTAFTTPEDRTSVYRRIRDRLADVPRVDSVGAISHLPLSGSVALDAFTSDLTGAASADQSVANYHAVLPGYFASVRTSFVAGRDITDAELDAAEPVVVIDETLARAAFGDADPIGRMLRLGWGIPDSRVVGVVAHARSIEVGRDVRPQVYAPFSTFRWAPLHFTVRAEGHPLDLRDSIDAAVREIGPGRAASGFQLLTENVELATSTQRSVTSLVAGLAISAGLLSAVGLYTVIAYLVHQRRRATAIRSALGATTLQLLRHNLRTTVVVMAVAVPLGGALAAAAAPVFASLIYGVGERDAASLGLAALVAAAAGAAGTLVPASRAARIDAALVLKGE
jgi:putative ABC transport system permease protein